MKKPAALGLIQDLAYLKHDTGAHPETSARLEAIRRRLDVCGLSAEASCMAPRAATQDEIATVHHKGFIEQVEAVCRSGSRFLDGADTAVCPVSYDVALLAAGAGLVAADQIASSEWKRAFCAVRPPGHHAEHAQALGFCLFNNVAVLARYVQNRHAWKKVLILDWDVHHGNGTQHIFEEDPDVYYISLHQWPFYPGTGASWQRGRGPGEGRTLNVPLPAGANDDAYLKAFDTKVLPEIDAFKPEIILLSAGFDAHKEDPLGGLRLSEGAYTKMTASVVALAESHSEGRVISLLEGGYNLDALARSVEAHVAALLTAA